MDNKVLLKRLGEIPELKINKHTKTSDTMVRRGYQLGYK